MCGIVGYLDRSGNTETPIGEILLRMLGSLCRRGPDSAGVATFGESVAPGWVLRIKLVEHGRSEEKVQCVVEGLRRLTPVNEKEVLGEFLRVVVGGMEVEALIEQVESVEGAEVVSLGHRLEIAKQVGSPENLERSYRIRSLRGTHGIGHTRLSTESRVDLSHSQPFWARGVPDLATVHNGHITNYHKLRRRYEHHGVRFITENDSEIIGVYLRDQMSRGRSFEEALVGSVDDFDGSFSYLAATADSLAFVKDRFALKPLVVTETEGFVAMGTEEIALRAGLDGDFRVFEPGVKCVQVWSTAESRVEAV